MFNLLAIQLNSDAEGNIVVSNRVNYERTVRSDAGLSTSAPWRDDSVGALRDHFECACRSKGLGGRCRRYAGPAGMSIGTGY